MDARERVRCALRCEKPDRIPKSLGFFPQSLDELKRVTAEDHFGLDIRFVEFNPLKNQDKFRNYLGGLPDDVHVGSLAQLRTYHEWNYHPERGTVRPLSHVRSLKELVQYVLPNFTNPDRHSKISSQVTRWHDQGLAVAGSPPHLGGELFEAAWRLRGFENFMIDLVQRKDMAGYLLDQLSDMMIENCLILAKAGIDILLLDDDIAMPSQMMISIETWREHFKPRLERVIRLVREESVAQARMDLVRQRLDRLMALREAGTVGREGVAEGIGALRDAEAALNKSALLVRDPQLVNYVNGIVCRVAGPYCSDFRVYLIRNPGFNASMTATGMMQIWIGSTAVMKR